MTKLDFLRQAVSVAWSDPGDAWRRARRYLRPRRSDYRARLRLSLSDWLLHHQHHVAFAECRWMVLPLREFPTAPAQGALAIEVASNRSGVHTIGAAIGVNVAIATAAVAAQVILPRLGHGPIPKGVLQEVQRLREADVRTLHRMQLAAQQLLVGGGPVWRRVVPRLLPLVLRSPLAPRAQRRGHRRIDLLCTRDHILN